MKTLKRILALALCLCTAFSMLAFTVAAKEKTGAGDIAHVAEVLTAFDREAQIDLADMTDYAAAKVEAQAGETFTYTVDKRTGEAGITGVRNCPRTMVVPSTIDGYKVTTIEEGAFRGQSNLVEAYLPETLNTIFSSSFADCTSLTRVILPSGMSGLIFGSTFDGCKSLREICTGYYYNGSLITVMSGFPEKLDISGTYVFRGCESLEAIRLPKGNIGGGIGSGWFDGCKSLNTVISYASHIFSNAFANCGTIREFVQLQVLDKVDKNAFGDTKIGTFAYSCSAAQFRKVAPNVQFADNVPEGGLIALGADMRYKAKGKLSDIVDKRITEYGGAFSTEDTKILKIEADGDTFTAVGKGDARIYHPMYDYMSKECGYEIPVYAHVSMEWWQTLIRIFLFGWIWY